MPRATLLPQPGWRRLCCKRPIGQRYDRFGMRLFGSGYRDLRRFMLRRIDRVAGEVNAFLIVAAIALGMFDLACFARKLVEALPPGLSRSARRVRDRLAVPQEEYA